MHRLRRLRPETVMLSVLTGFSNGKTWTEWYNSEKKKWEYIRSVNNNAEKRVVLVRQAGKSDPLCGIINRT